MPVLKKGKQNDHDDSWACYTDAKCTSALKVMKKLIQKSVDRKLIDKNIIKDTAFLLLLICSDQADFIFWSDLKLANKINAWM